MTAPAASRRTGAAGTPPDSLRAGAHALGDGYYHLTLVAAVLQACSEIHVRVLPGVPSASVLEVVVVPAFLCLVAEMLHRPPLWVRTRALMRENPLVVCYAGYALLASFVGLPHALDTLRAFHDLFVALALYTLVGLTIDDAVRRRGVLAAVMMGAAGNAALALCQFVAGGPYLVKLSENITGKLDLNGDFMAVPATGLFNHPNGLAVYLLPIFVFLGVAAWNGFGEPPRRRPHLALVLAPMAVALVLTYAKGVYAWLLAGLCVVVVQRWCGRFRVALAVVVVVGGIAALTWLSLSAFLDGDLVFSTIVGRIELWMAALRILGADDFVAVFGGGDAQLFGQTFTFEYTNAHNAWLDQALTYGIPALALYLGAYVTAFVHLARRIRYEPPPTRSIALAAFGALVAILGESFFEPTNHSVGLQAELFLLLAIAASLPETTARSAARDRSSRAAGSASAG